MQISIKPELEQFVTEKIRAGEYSDASALVNQAIENLKEQEEFLPAHEAYLRRELAKGIDQLDRGEYAEFDAKSIIAEERQRLRERGHG